MYVNGFCYKVSGSKFHFWISLLEVADVSQDRQQCNPVEHNKVYFIITAICLRMVAAPASEAQRDFSKRATT